MYIRKLTFRRPFPTTDHFPFNIRTFQGTDSVELNPPLVFFAGDNGAGKSTLLDAIAAAAGLTAWGGRKTHRVHNNPYENSLPAYIQLEWVRRRPYGFYFRAETFFNQAATLDEILEVDPGRGAYYGGGSLNAVSHGESFLKMFQSYSYELAGLYLMDEPEAALSPRGQLAFMKLVEQRIKDGKGQYIIATQSPILLAAPSALILDFDGEAITAVPFTATGSYTFYRDFMADPSRLYAAGEEE